MTSSSPELHRWVKLSEIAERYGIPPSKVNNLLQRGAWHCHRQSGMVRFSPDDQIHVERKWQQHGGEDPPERTPSWRELAMKDKLTDAEHAAVERGYEASRYLRSLEQ